MQAMMLSPSPHFVHHLHNYIRNPHGMSYCIALALRRACSVQATSPEKVKRRKRSEKKEKLAPDSDRHNEGVSVEGKIKHTESSAKKKTNKLMDKHVEHEPKAVQDILHEYSETLYRRKQEPEVFYIINKEIADQVVRNIPAYSRRLPHLELGPGPGVLTRALLAAGVGDINCFEPSLAFRAPVQKLQEESGGSVRLTPLNLLHLPKMQGAAAHGDERRLAQALRGLSRRAWQDGPCLRIVGVAHRSTFFRFLVHTVLFREHMFQFGRPELLVYVPDSEYRRLSAVPGMSGHVYRPYSILSQILFEIEELHRLPAKQFYPWMVSRKKVSFIDSEMVLIRYTPRADPGLPEAELPKLDFFVRHCAVSKTRRIVLQLEEWVPGCGPRLIAMGHGVFEPFRELTPPELLRLFKEFASWPEYAACSFHTAVQQNTLGGEPEEQEEQEEPAEEDAAAEDFESDR